MKRFLIILLVIALTVTSALFLFMRRPNTSNLTSVTSTPLPTNKEYTEDYLQYLESQILSGGPPKDGIPPIDNPIYVSIEESDYLNDFDKVFVYEAKEEVYIYPQRILVWHEIVNDTIDNENVAITYCPLTGSTICYLTTSNLETNTYGTSGKLLNSNLVMYDRKTDSYIPQILGIGINNDLKNVTLPIKPVHWANWKDAKEAFPSAKVLSTDTGFFRDYNQDPYGSYLPDSDNSYYYFGEPIFPVLNENDQFVDKKIVVGIKHNSKYIALDPLLVREKKVLDINIDESKAVALYDEELKTVRIFLNSDHLSFIPTENGYTDNNGLKYSYRGQSKNSVLKPLNYFDVMWFAWYAYYPDTEVIK